MRKAAGFTLVEVLLALAILASVLLAAHLILFSTLTARERIQVAGDPVSSVQSLGWLIREDLRGIVSLERTAGWFQSRPVEVANEGKEFLSFLTVSDPRHHRSDSGLFLVSYQIRLNRDDPDTLDLLRSEVAWRNGPLGRGSYEPLFRGLDSLDIAYYAGGHWSSEWPSDTDVPPAVSITLGLPRADAEEPEVYEIVAWVPAGGSPADVGGVP